VGYKAAQQEVSEGETKTCGPTEVQLSTACFIKCLERVILCNVMGKRNEGSIRGLEL